MDNIKHVNLIQTGGTIGMSAGKDGALGVNSQAQSKIEKVLSRIPNNQYQLIPVPMSGDSSDHPRSDLIELGRTVLKHEKDAEGTIVVFGTDSMNITAATLALMGTEAYTTPVVLLGSVRDFNDRRSDAPANTITAGIFAAHGDASGVFAVRKNGVIISSRHDTWGGATDWHGRGIEDRKDMYCVRVDLEKIATFNEKRDTWSFRGLADKWPQKLEDLIHYESGHFDGALDCVDIEVTSDRGELPNLTFSGMWGSNVDRVFSILHAHASGSARKIIEGVEKVYQDGFFVGKILPYFVFLENMLRGNGDTENWRRVFSKLFRTDLGLSKSATDPIIDFWVKYSGASNDSLDFSRIQTLEGNGDPNHLYDIVKSVPTRGIVIRGTGAGGLRLKDPDDSYRKALEYCREQRIPVVVTANSRGEVTALNYGPHRALVKEDLAFFSGTMDADLLIPRMALLNHEENRGFIGQLIDATGLEGDKRQAFERNMYRQLLSGSHYRGSYYHGSTKDRQEVQRWFGIETSVELLSMVHAKKAMLASFLHEVLRRKMNVPDMHECLKG